MSCSPSFSFNNPISRIQLEYSSTSTSSVLLSGTRIQYKPRGLANIVKSPRDTEIELKLGRNNILYLDTFIGYIISLCINSGVAET